MFWSIVSDRVFFECSNSSLVEQFSFRTSLEYEIARNGQKPRTSCLPSNILQPGSSQTLPLQAAYQTHSEIISIWTIKDAFWKILKFISSPSDSYDQSLELSFEHFLRLPLFRSGSRAVLAIHLTLSRVILEHAEAGTGRQYFWPFDEDPSLRNHWGIIEEFIKIIKVIRLFE